MIAAAVVDLPAPGGPVRPTTRADDAPKAASTCSRPPFSIRLSNRPVARADPLCAASMRSATFIARCRRLGCSVVESLGALHHSVRRAPMLVGDPELGKCGDRVVGGNPGQHTLDFSRR